jgi:hypothetical protein
VARVTDDGAPRPDDDTRPGLERAVAASSPAELAELVEQTGKALGALIGTLALIRELGSEPGTTSEARGLADLANFGLRNCGLAGTGLLERAEEEALGIVAGTRGPAS